MYEQGRVTRLRRLLNHAAGPSADEHAPLVGGLGPEAQRRLQVLEIKALVSLYGLASVLEACLARADRASVESLPVSELQALTARLRRAAERVEYACDDARTPPAR